MNRLLLPVAGLVLGAATHAAELAPTAFELAMVNMQGQKTVLGTLPGSAFSPRVSPEGKRVAFELADETAPASAQATRLYVAQLDKLDKPRPLQYTLTSLRNMAAVWSADGDWVVFQAGGNGPDAIFIQRADGSIQPRWLVDGRAPEGLYNGGQLAFITRTGEHDYGVSMLDTNTGKVTRLADQSGSDQHSSRISADGRWIAYASTETGRQEVWVEPLPQTGKRFQLTQRGGRHPLWSPDSKSIYFDQDGRMYRLDVTFDGESARASTPVPLPITGFQQGDLRRQFDLMPDGTAFLMLFPAQTAR